MPQPPPQDPRPRPPALSTADAPLTPSTSQRKRGAQALQAIGVQLVALSAAQLARLDLPEALHEAVVAARARQMQSIGKVMRQIEPTARRSGPMDRGWCPTTAGVTSPRPRPSATHSSHTGRHRLARSRRSDPTRPAGVPRQHGRPPAGPRRGLDARGFVVPPRR